MDLRRLTVCAVLCCVGAEAAHALPVIVQARSRIELLTERSERGLVLRGKLVDDSGAPIASEGIRVDVMGLTLPVVLTDAQGRFEYLVPAAHLIEVEARYGAEIPWTATFFGEKRYAAAESKGTLDLRRLSTRLGVDIAPQQATIDTDWIMVRARLRARQRPVFGAAIKLRVGDGSEQQGRTDSNGIVRFRLRPADLGALGEIPVRVRFSGDHRRGASHMRGSFTVSRSTRITLRVGREGRAATGRYRFSGRLVDARGPIARATVAIIATSSDARRQRDDAESVSSSGAPRTVAVATTDKDGIFLTALPARALFADSRGVIDLWALYQPQQASWSVARSRPVAVPVPSPPGIPIRWYVAGILWVLAGLALAHIARNRLWTTLVNALARRRRRRRPTLKLEEPFLNPPFVQSASTRSTPPRRDRVCGMVVDAHSARPVPGTRVAVVGVDRVFEVYADPSGGFDLGPIPAGRYALTMEADRYIGREIAFNVPHEGFLDSATFTLVAVRRRIRDLYKSALTRLQQPWAWGSRTPREAHAAAHSLAARAGAENPLSELRDLTERAWFSESGARSADAVRATELLEAVPEPRRRSAAP